jgi:hypothetical protein
MTFQTEQDAVIYGRKLLRKHPHKQEVFITVNAYVLAVTRDSFCHASLYRPTQEVAR